MPDATSAFDIRDGSIRIGDQIVLSSIDAAIPDGKLTVFLGPSAVGKSLVLSSLAGRHAASGIVLGGTWCYRGQPLSGTIADRQRIAICERRSRRVNAERERCTCGADCARDALATGANVVLLDDPTMDCSDADIVRLIEGLRTRPAGSTVIMVTHNIALAEAVADYVCFFVAGRLHAACSASDFFNRPPSELAQRFIRWGNCWPEASRPSLPSHFHWLLPGRLAGMGRPGLLSDIDDDLTAVALAGIQLLVSLEESEFSPEQLRAFGLRGRHLPILDMGVPALAMAAGLCRDIEQAIQTGTAVALHCKAGAGRTGTMLGAFLVWSGCSPERAIDTVREISPGYIQNRQQERFIHDFAQGVRT